MASLREPQQDRSRATRQRLLEAAVECLAEYGWSGTTVAAVAERAGASRGATQHYFPMREDLFAATADHMTDVRFGEIRQAAAALSAGERRTETVLEILAGLYLGPLFQAALQLWVAASTDEQLRGHMVALEARLGREAHRLAVELLRVDESRPGARQIVQGTLDLVRGLGLAALLTDDTARRKEVLRAWAGVLDTVLPPAGTKVGETGRTAVSLPPACTHTAAVDAERAQALSAELLRIAGELTAVLQGGSTAVLPSDLPSS